MKMRMDVSNADVLKLYNHFKSKRVVAAFLDCSEQLIRNVLNGDRRDPSELSKPPSGKMCSCCKVQPVKPGNRFLCEWCHTHRSNPDEYCVNGPSL